MDNIDLLTEESLEDEYGTNSEAVYIFNTLKRKDKATQQLDEKGDHDKRSVRILTTKRKRWWIHAEMLFIVFTIVLYYNLTARVDASIFINMTVGAERVHYFGNLLLGHGISWKNAFIMGFITTFHSVSSTATAILTNACGPAFTDAVHLTRGANTQYNVTTCAIYGAVLALSLIHI